MGVGWSLLEKGGGYKKCGAFSRDISRNEEDTLVRRPGEKSEIVLMPSSSLLPFPLRKEEPTSPDPFYE